MSNTKLGKKPLFSDKELKVHKAKQAKLEKQWNSKKISYDDFSTQRNALNQSFTISKVRRAQARAEEFLTGLLTLVANNGRGYIVFDWIFNHQDGPDADECREVIEKADTPEARRDLYTVLRALTEIPKSWGSSAFTRFLRGTGKQKGAQYHGAGRFSSDYGWKEREVKAFVDVITGGSWGNSPYCEVLMTYADVEQEIRDAENAGYELVDYNARFCATRAERDVDFINQLCEMLEKPGLGPVPTPAAKKPKKVRRPKVFKSGDIIRKTNLRDLPLPAHVRLNIEKYDEDSKQWLADTMEQVVTALTNYGQYSRYYVMPGTKRAYPENIRYSSGEYKDKLFGATYLGVWKGQLVQTKEMKINFRWRKRQD